MITSVQYDYQQDLESSLKGFYSNSFFHIYIDGGFDIDISKIAEDKDKGTALHEYTHYIQNIGTLWGLYNSIYNYDVIIQFKKAVYAAKEIKRPFTVPLTEILERKKKYVNHGNGTTGYYNWNIDDTKPIRYDLIKVVNNVKEELRTDVTFTLDNGEEKTIQLGAHIIKESMAALYQSLLDSQVVHDDVPYNLVRKLAEKHFKNTAGDVRKLICCCHASLFCMSPGSCLIELLQEAEKNPNMNGFQLFDQFVHTKEVVTWRGERKSMVDFFNEMVDGFKKRLETNLVSPLDYIATALEKVRLDGQHYPFLSVLYDNEPFSEKDFTDLVGYYGVPYIQTSNHGYYYPKGSGENKDEASADVLELIAQEALYFSFVDKDRLFVCPLYYMCQDSEYAKAECFDRPWEGTDCAYTIVSDFLCLKDKNIK